MKIVKVSPSNLGGGRRGWGGPIFFLEDNLAFQNNKISTLKLKAFGNNPIFKFGDRQHTTHP